MRRLLLLLILAAGTAAAELPPEVATVIATDGPVTWMRGASPWYAAFPEQRSRVEDHLRTGPESVATLEFDVGGKVGLNTDTEVVLTGDRSVESVGLVQKIVVQCGGIWAKISGQRTEMQVQTSGGVMGIKGTEFTVDVEEDGSTTLSVLEGEVEVRPDEGEPVTVGPASQARFARRVKLVLTRFGSVDELREHLRSRRWRRYLMLQAAIMALKGRWPGFTAQQIDVVRDPLTLKTRVQPGRRPVRRVDFAAGLSPDGVEVAGRPSFRWEPMEGAAAYAVLLSGQPEVRRLDWAALTKEPRAEYPANGAPLAPGRYWWRVIPLDERGKPAGRASQTWFELRG